MVHNSRTGQDIASQLKLDDLENNIKNNNYELPEPFKIDPEVISKDDIEMLQDLIVAAVNDAHRKADEEMQKKMGGMLPPGMKF